MGELRKNVLPAQLEDLRFLAYNLRWNWDTRAQSVFERLDPTFWAASRYNPVTLLTRLDPLTLEIAAHDDGFIRELRTAADELRAYLASSNTWWKRTHSEKATFAYFSAEFAITQALPIFSGGLGVLAGDHLKSASDLGIPLVAVGLMYREGYFAQRLDAAGNQHETYDHADPARLPLTLEVDAHGDPLLVSFPMRDRRAFAQIWRADVGRVPLYLLDTDVPENTPEDRAITDRLYGGDNEHRLRQEIVLGIGGMRALNALGISPDVIHLNEGHAAFAAVERVRKSIGDAHGTFGSVAQRMSQGVVFTTHTPVPAGHDMFATHLMERYLGGYIWEMREPWRRFLALGRHDPTDDDEPFNMTLLALRLSGRRNGVSHLHGVVSRRMWWGVWPGLGERDVPIGHITNGVHLPTWTSRAMAAVYAEHVSPEWQDAADEVQWQRAAHLPLDVLWQTRNELRGRLVTHVRKLLASQLAHRGEDTSWADRALDPNALTIVFARRFATYKRATLLLSDPQRLANLLMTGRVQFVFAGKAHPKDEPGKDLIRQIFNFSHHPAMRERFVFLEEYDVALARYLVSGADVWLNVPRRPYEASGTSGMKAAANGALNLSIPDGWWAEAWREHNHGPHPIGWSIGSKADDGQDRADAESLFTLLEQDVVPLFWQRDETGLPVDWTERVRSSIRQVVPYFNTHRMVREYAENAYVPAYRAVRDGDADLLKSG